jgi:hypothetical protein
MRNTDPRPTPHERLRVVTNGGRHIGSQKHNHSPPNEWRQELTATPRGAAVVPREDCVGEKVDSLRSQEPLIAVDARYLVDHRPQTMASSSARTGEERVVRVSVVGAVETKNVGSRPPSRELELGRPVRGVGRATQCDRQVLACFGMYCHPPHRSHSRCVGLW